MMLAQFVVLAVVFALCWPIAQNWGRYLTWRYPQYHQDDKQRAIAYVCLAVCALVLLIVLMAND